MKNSRLFWKVLLSFWLTFFFLVPAIWMPVTVVFGERLSPVAEQPEAPGAADDGLLADPSPAQGVSILMNPVRDHDAFVRFWWELLIVGGIGGLVFSVLLARYLAKPVAIVQDGFARLAEGNFDVRLGGKLGGRKDELANLAQDFDTMAHRLDTLVSARDRVLHDLSHEIRSPLSRLLVAVALIQQQPSRAAEMGSRIESEVERLTFMVEEVLALARAESRAHESVTYYDPLIVTGHVVDDTRFEAQSSGVAIELVEPAGARLHPAVKGSAQLLIRALENVLRNAVRFSPPGSAVVVSTAIETGDENQFILTIEDSGPGVSPGKLATIFDAFSEHSGEGFGLGLSIARRAIVAQTGHISAANRPSGGLAITICLPIEGRNCE